MSPLVLAEVDQLAAARFGSQARTSLIDFILFQARRDRVLLPHVTIDLLETGRSVQPKYAALNLDLADAVNVALAAEYRSHSLLTLDRRDSRDQPADPRTRRSNSCPTRCSAHQACRGPRLPDRFEAGRRAGKRPSARLAHGRLRKADGAAITQLPRPGTVRPWTVWALGCSCCV